MEKIKDFSYLNYVSSPILIFNKEKQVLFFNSALEKSFKINENQLINKNIHSLFELLNIPLISVNKITIDSEEETFLRLKIKDGRIFSIKVIPIQEYDDCLLMEFNYEENDSLIQRFNKQENQFNLVIDNLPFDLWAMDNDWHYSLQNQSSKNKWGDIIGKKIEDLNLNKEVETAWIEQDKKVFAGETLNTNFAMIENGKEKYFESIITPILFEDHIEGILGLTMDVSDKIKAATLENKIKQQNKALLDHISDIAWLKNKNNQFQSVNKAFEDLFAVSSEEINNLSEDDFLSKNNILKKELNTILTSKGQVIKEEEYSINNEKITFETIITPIINNNELIGYTGLSRNISKRIIIEEEKLKKEKLESLGIIAGGIAHDFNNILMGVLGNVQLALDCTDDVMITEPLEDALTFIRKSSLMVKELLSLSKGKKHSLDLVCINDIIKSLKTDKRNIQVDKFYNKELPEININRSQIEQVLDNLFKNAIEAITKDGQIKIASDKVDVDEGNIYLLKPGEYLIVTIADNGSGINNDDLKHIFEPYFSRKKYGTGLGLASAYSIIKSYGGTIYVESEIFVKTEFSVFIPINNID